MQTQLEKVRLRLEALMEIGRLLMSTAEPEELLQVILQSAIRLFSAEGCSIALLDEAGKELSFAFVVGGAKVEEFRIGLGQGFIGWVAQTGEGVFCNNVSKDPRFFGTVDRRTGFKTRSILCAPLRRQDRLMGSIEVLNTTSPEGFTEEDLRLLTAFGGLAVTAMDRAQMFASVRNTSAASQEVLQDRYRLVLGKSLAMEEVVRLARTAAATPATVLLLGESGTGKEVVARAIHQWSPRAEKPFVAVNCVALSPELLESELFGHERGAFTGAIAQKKGKFELAHGGTLFLDEIGDLAPHLQAKLLRVLQEREFQRVGGIKDIRVDVRVVAATNRNLLEAMQKGSFREDLYYRLNVVSLTLPPLRERREDIPVLVEHFIQRYCREMKRPPMKVEERAMELLQAYGWPGNIRELQNTIERAVVLTSGSVITEADLPARIHRPALDAEGPLALGEIPPLTKATDDFKRTLIRRALEASGGNQTQAARLLGLRQSNLSRMMKSLGMR